MFEYSFWLQKWWWAHEFYEQSVKAHCVKFSVTGIFKLKHGICSPEIPACNHQKLHCKYYLGCGLWINNLPHTSCVAWDSWQLICWRRTRYFVSWEFCAFWVQHVWLIYACAASASYCWPFDTQLWGVAGSQTQGATDCWNSWVYSKGPHFTYPLNLFQSIEWISQKKTHAWLLEVLCLILMCSTINWNSSLFLWIPWNFYVRLGFSSLSLAPFSCLIFE
jgi:hypothetical protein